MLAVLVVLAVLAMLMLLSLLHPPVVLAAGCGFGAVPVLLIANGLRRPSRRPRETLIISLGGGGGGATTLVDRLVGVCVYPRQRAGPRHTACCGCSAAGSSCRLLARCSCSPCSCMPPCRPYSVRLPLSLRLSPFAPFLPSFCRLSGFCSLFPLYPLLRPPPPRPPLSLPPARPSPNAWRSTALSLRFKIRPAPSTGTYLFASAPVPCSAPPLGTDGCCGFGFRNGSRRTAYSAISTLSTYSASSSEDPPQCDTSYGGRGNSDAQITQYALYWNAGSRGRGRHGPAVSPAADRALTAHVVPLLVALAEPVHYPLRSSGIRAAAGHQRVT